MKSAAEEMSFYEAYHKHPMNKATHFVGIPLIVFAIFVPLTYPSVPAAGWVLTPALPLALSFLVYYYLLDRTLGFGMALFILPTLVLAHLAARTTLLNRLLIFVAAFGAGWLFQLIGP